MYLYGKRGHDMKTLIKNGIVILDGIKRLNNGAVMIEGGKITGIYKDYEGLEADSVIDVQNNYIIPGLLDNHTHGAMGYDFNKCSSKQELEIISDSLLDEGVTGFNASIVCESHHDTLNLLQMYEGNTPDNLIGVHLEGPYLNIKNKGVMKEEHLRLVNFDEFNQYISTCRKVNAMTIAPELPNALELINYASNHGYVMNVGHSSASAKEVKKAQAYGAKGITHLYNAMSQHLHRDPGVVTGAILSDLMCELIVDGFHIDEDVIRATYKAIGKERIILITDANPCKGLPDGQYHFSGKDIVIVGGHATVKETGRIAGSTLGLNEACANMMRYCDCSIDDAVLMAAVNPAKLYGLKQGKIEIGYQGDIVVIDKEFTILAVINRGIIKRNKFI